MQRDAQSSGHATEQALVLTPNAQTRQELAEAEAERADISFVSLCTTLAEFLMYVVREAWPWPSRDDATEQAVSSGHATEQARSSGQATQEAQPSSHATEQAQSSGHAAEEAPGQGDIVYDDDCVDLHDLVYEHIEAWSQRPSNQILYSEPHLLRHKRMWDVLVGDKAGLSKENTFLRWCRRVHSHSERANTVSTTSMPSSSATQQVAPGSFKALAEDLLSNYLTPAQRGEKKYMIRRNKKTREIVVTNLQRSWINVVLRKNLGDAKVAYFIFNDGLPALLDVSPRSSAPRKAMLQNMLEELMTWHASLLHSLLDHESHPDMANARKLASLDERLWQQERREKQAQAREAMVQGQRLVEERDSKKRTYQEMSATEQQLLEDFETNKSRRRYAEARAARLPSFRGKMLSAGETREKSASTGGHGPRPPHSGGKRP